MWDAATGKHLRRIVAAWQRAIALSPDGRYLTWPIEDESLKYSPPAHPTWIYTGCRIRLYDLTADKFVARFPAFKGDAWTSAFTPDGETLLTVDYRDAVVRLWDVAAGKEQRTFRIARTEETREHFIRHVVLSPDGKTLAAAYDRADNTSLLFGAVVVRLWDVATGKELHELTGHVNSVEGLAFSPDSRLMATAGENGLGNSVFVWDVATGERRDGAGWGPGNRGRQRRVLSRWPQHGHGVRGRDHPRLGVGNVEGAGRVQGPPRPREHVDFHPRQPPPLRRPGHDRPGVEPGPDPANKPFAATVNALAEPDAAAAFQAQGAFAAEPAKAIAWIAERIKPAVIPDPKRLPKLMADLDSPEFTVRDQATKELRELSDRAAEVLREAAEKSESLEVRRRARTLLAELDTKLPSLKYSAACGPWNFWNGSPPRRPANGSATGRRGLPARP